MYAGAHMLGSITNLHLAAHGTMSTPDTSCSRQNDVSVTPACNMVGHIRSPLREGKATGTLILIITSPQGAGATCTQRLP